jgi:hypothetical protein
VSEAIRFLHALAQAFSAMNLYAPGHPAATRAITMAWQALEALLAQGPDHDFLFLGTAPIHAGRPLHELASWPWSPRLTKVDLHRIEFHAGITEDAFRRFLARVQARFIGGGIAGDESEEGLEGIDYGPVVVEEAERAGAGRGMFPAHDAPGPEGGAELVVDMRDELEAFQFIRTEAAAGRVAWAEAEAIVRLLIGYALQVRLPQVATSVTAEEYPAVHAINTTCLVIGAGRATGLERADLHRLAIAALLHDLGMAVLPARLTGASELSEADRAAVETHPALGAELLLSAGGAGADLAAIVAWEHHLRPDGTGYPQRRFRAPAHWASRLVSAASTYAALRCLRPFRAPWAPERALAYLKESAGTVHDVEAARSIIAIVRG